MILLLFFLKNSLWSIFTFFYFTFIANSKIGVGSRVIFQSGKGFHRQKCLKIVALNYYLSSLKTPIRTFPSEVITECPTKSTVII
jgi:hypothetical protein